MRSKIAPDLPRLSTCAFIAYTHCEKCGAIFFRRFAQRCANSQPNHLLGNIFPNGPTAGQDFPNKWATVVGQLKGHIFAKMFVKIRNNYARVK